MLPTEPTTFLLGIFSLGRGGGYVLLRLYWNRENTTHQYCEVLQDPLPPEKYPQNMGAIDVVDVPKRTQSNNESLL